MKKWLENRKHQSRDVEQLTWAAHVLQYVVFVWKSCRVHGGTKTADKQVPTALPYSIPILGPRFLPPQYLHLQTRQPLSKITPNVQYLRPLTVLHPFYLDVSACPQCRSPDIVVQGWNGTGPREVHGVREEETAIGYQFRCGECKTQKKPYCFSTTNTEFWQHLQHWEIPRKSLIFVCVDLFTYKPALPRWGTYLLQALCSHPRAL